MTERIEQKDVLGHPDALLWAKFFMQTLADNPDLKISEDLMMGWFANAMCTAEDAYRIKKMLEEAGCETMDEYIDRVLLA